MSITVYPTILHDSSTGSDTAASGAGPSTALTGSTAVSTGTTVVLDAGTVLTGVATDGSHVLWFNDTTAGNRNFTAINGTSGSGGATPTVTVEQTLATTTKSWAIGGKRLTISSVSSKRLWNNNGSGGDAKPGWTIEFQDGFTDSLSVTFDILCAGDTTTGPITFRSATGYTTQPEISVSVADRACTLDVQSVRLENFAIRGTSCTLGIVFFSGDCTAFGMKVYMSSGTFSQDTIYIGGINISIIGCKLLNSGRHGINIPGDPQGCMILGNVITSPVSNGIDISSGSGIVKSNLITGAGGDGINNSINSNGFRRWNIDGNTIDSCAGDGIEFTQAADSTLASTIVNNILSNNGGYNINISGCSDGYLRGGGIQVLNNNTYNGTSGAYHSSTGGYTNNSCPWATGDLGLNPQYVGSGDYTPTNAALAGTAIPESFP